MEILYSLGSMIIVVVIAMIPSRREETELMKQYTETAKSIKNKP